MNTNLLPFLQTIQETGSISQTARQLYVTQPYVSRLIKEAETEYHVALLNRDQHPLTLTNAGRTLLDYLRQQQQLQENMRHELADFADEKVDALTICTNSSFGHDWYAQILQHFIQKQPNVILKTIELPYQEAEKQFRAGLVDIVMDKPIIDRNVTYQHILDFPILLLIPASSPLYLPDMTWRDFQTLDWKDLNNQPFISVNSGSSFQQMINAKLLSLNLTTRRFLEVTNLQTATLLALKQIGLTFAPELVMQTLPMAVDTPVNIIPLPKDVLIFDFGINVPDRLVGSPLVTDLIASIKTTIGI